MPGREVPGLIGSPSTSFALDGNDQSCTAVLHGRLMPLHLPGDYMEGNQPGWFKLVRLPAPSEQQGLHPASFVL